MLDGFPRRSWIAAAALVIAVEVNAGVSFDVRTDIPAGSGPVAVAVSKLNADPYPDLLVADDRGFEVLLGSGQGRFSTPQTVRSQPAPSTLCSADFDGNGTADVAFASTLAKQVRIQSGLGDGGFGPLTTLPIGGRPYLVLAADVTGDKLPDLLVGHGDGLAVLVSRGAKGFGVAHELATDFPVRQFTYGDFNADGKVDLAILESDGEAVGIFAGDGSGDFQPLQASPVGLDPRAIAVPRDLTGDQHVDLVVADERGVEFLRGDDTGGFEPARLLLPSNDVHAVATVDANHDGNLDVAALDGRRGAVVVLLGDGHGKFSVSSAYGTGASPQSLLAADVTGDALPDILTAIRLTSTVTLMAGQRDGTFRAPLVIDAGADPAAAAVGDFNGDQHLDLAVANTATDSVEIMLGNGHGDFQKRATLRVGREPKAILVGHFDNDGYPDLVVADFAADDVAVLAGDGRGDFAAPLLVATGLGPVALVSADFDRDGHPDVAVANSLSNSVSILFGDGRGRFPRSENYAVLPRPNFLMTGALSGDRMVDLVVGSSRADKVSILHGGPNGLSAPVDGNVGTRIHPLVSDDFNNDGRIDLAVTDEGDNRVSILLGMGPNEFAPAVHFAVGRRPVALAAGDFNEDRRIDLAVLQRGARAVLILLNTTTITPNATGGPTPRPAAATPGIDPWKGFGEGW